MSSGWRMPESAKEAIRKAKTGIHLSQEAKDKIGRANTGKRRTEEQRLAQSERMKSIWARSPERREKQRQRTSHLRTPQAREKAKASSAKRWAGDAAYRGRVRAHLRDVSDRPEVRAKFAASHAGKRLPESVRNKISAAARARFAAMGPEDRGAHLGPARLAAATASPSSIERLVGSALREANVDCRAQVPIDRYVVDFLVGEDLVVECDGDYWHSLERVAQKDLRKDARLRALGYRVLRLREDSIRESEGRVVLLALNSAS